MFGPLGGPELLLVFVIALIVFGPRKLPEIGKSLGKMLSEFRRASNDLKRTIEDEVEAERLREVSASYSGGTSATTPPAIPSLTSDTSAAPLAGAPSVEAEPRPATEPGPDPAAPASPPASADQP